MAQDDPVILTFVIPVRHPDNMKDSTQMMAHLAATLNSLAAQEHPGWHALIVANHGTSLPPLPDKCEVVWVDFPPNPYYVRNSGDKSPFYDAVRLDKGRRVLAGMRCVHPGGYVMVVDDDDCVSRRLVSFVAQQSPEAGWYIDKGYVWNSGSRLVYRHDRFHDICGTSLIARTDLFDIPLGNKDIDDHMVRQLYGSHIFPYQHFSKHGHTLLPLPFEGALYRIGYDGQHSRSNMWVRMARHVYKKRTLPEIGSALAGLSKLTPAIQQEFMGNPSGLP